ncbi:MAG TPA: HdeD family acid-resistance protein [Ktedonobacteraceae bacterium]|nr:HdeD family acid-resistance protein [Ktedonobacteraceae bacterium]
MKLSALQQSVVNYWPVLLIRGIVSFIFGILALIWPGHTLLFLVYLFGAYALVNGIMTVVGSLRDREASSHWWLPLISGIAGVILGLLVFFWPARSAPVLFTFIGIWAIVIGLFEFIAAITLPGGLGLHWPLVLGGILAIIVGAIFIRHPFLAMLAVVWLLGAFAIVYGIVLCIRAFQYRSHARALPS